MRKIAMLFVALLLCFSFSFAQTRSVSGVVSDEAGNPLAGVSVQVSGTNTGTTTKPDGSFTLSVSSSAKALNFSSVGWTSKSVTLSSSNFYEVTMEMSTSQLDEVVIIGYGSAKKRADVAGALTTVSGEQIHDRPSANVIDALQGKVSGLQVYSSSGEPSSTPSVRLHGVGSLGASNTPLYVLDGIPVGAGTIVSLNPEDIESVTVLKDPSTTSIYGSRASNGVIYYTTKQGKVNTSNLNVSSQYGISNLTNASLDMFNNFMNTKELTDFWLDIGYRNQAQIDALLAQYPYDTKWYKTYYKNNVPMYQLDVNMSGGGGKTTYYVSGGYYKQEGLTYRSDFERFTFRSNLQSTVNNWFKFGLTLSAGKDTRQSNPYGSNSTNRGLALLAAPFYSPVDADGKPYPDMIPGWGRYNPKYLGDKNPSEGKNLQFNPSAYAEISPIKGLIFKTQAGIDGYDYTSYDIRMPSYIGSLNNGSVSESFSRGTMSTVTNTLEYKFGLGKSHDFTALAGQEYIKGITTGFSGSSTGQSDDRLILLGNGPQNKNVSSSKTEYAYLSYFGRLNYGYEGKYFADLSLRQDQSSRFGRDNRTATFWSAGLLWKASKENFFIGSDWVSDLNVRASYGTSGNSSIGDYSNLATVGTNQYDGTSGFGIANAGNPLLSWESQSQFTGGIDVLLFKKINMTIDYYRRETKDQLFSVPFPYTSGFSTILYNVGSIRNSGIDLEISANVLKTRDAYITPFVSFNYNKNMVTDLFQGRDYWVIPNTGVSYVIGQPVSFLYPIWAGVNPANGDPQWYLPDPDPEKFVYKNTDKQRVTSVFNSGDLQQGTGIQRYAPINGGFGVDAGLKGFYLNAYFIFSQGKYLINNDGYFFLNPNQFPGFNQSRDILDYWKKPGDEARFPRYGVQFMQFDSRLLENASFMRLKALTLGYRFPKTLLERTRVFKSVEAYVTGRNLWTLTKYTGPDPEIDANLSLGANPNTRQTAVGLKFQF